MGLCEDEEENEKLEGHCRLKGNEGGEGGGCKDDDGGYLNRRKKSSSVSVSL